MNNVRDESYHHNNQVMMPKHLERNVVGEVVPFLFNIPQPTKESSLCHNNVLYALQFMLILKKNVLLLYNVWTDHPKLSPSAC